ncbi:hypothetical protein BJY01DRAFT_58643 [Aspergillus pseudoustus]|uniref:Uncharacterized protein n=1 Tax=Aspergillus pseudoustus TaxID=1810923 RepID=A0ABR4KNK0_9EURO
MSNNLLRKSRSSLRTKLKFHRKTYSAPELSPHEMLLDYHTQSLVMVKIQFGGTGDDFRCLASRNHRPGHLAKLPNRIARVTNNSQHSDRSTNTCTRSDVDVLGFCIFNTHRQAAQSLAQLPEDVTDCTSKDNSPECQMYNHLVSHDHDDALCSSHLQNIQIMRSVAVECSAAITVPSTRDEWITSVGSHVGELSLDAALMMILPILAALYSRVCSP